ncbi:MAG: hypothetical protein MUP63_03070 [Candidatus Nanohaloarchaeota archaeon QJJ-7]|nr:hypothetical protein [Candidatus Nanohaloarchaeota archaeon QJJ-7]
MANGTDGLEVEKASIEEEGVEFAFRNSSHERVYDVVKLYSGDKYDGFEYVDIPAGEESSVVFDVREGEINENDRVILTTDSLEEGVIAESVFGDLLGGEEPGTGQAGEEEEIELEDQGNGEREFEEQEVKVSEEEKVGEPEPEKIPGEETEGPGGMDPEDDGESLKGVRGDEETTIKLEDFSGKEDTEPHSSGINDVGPVQGEESSWSNLSSTISSFFGGGREERGREISEEETSGEELEIEGGGENGQEDLDNPGPGDEVQEDSGLSREPGPSEQVPRTSTGVINLDGKMQGGLVKDTMNLVTGKTGTGKTAFSACFLKQGVEEGENGVYVTTEERKEDIHEDIRAMFGWDFTRYEEEGSMEVMSIKPVFPSKEIDNLNRLVRSYITDLLNEVKTAIEEIDAERVVIDSVSIIEMFIRDEYMARVALSKLLNSLREEEVTAVFTGGIPETSEGLSGGGIIEYLVDTVILLEFVPVAEEHTRTLSIRKMRRTDHEVEIFPLEITPQGMKIEEVEERAI